MIHSEKSRRGYKRPVHWQRQRNGAPAVGRYGASEATRFRAIGRRVCEWPNPLRHPISSCEALHLIEKGVVQGIGVDHGDESLQQGFHLRQPVRDPLGLLQEPVFDVS